MGTSYLFISDLLNMWPKVRWVPWPLHYKSMEKNENASRSVCAHSNSPSLLKWWCFGTAVIKCFFSQYPPGMSREVIEGCSIFWSISFHWKEIERWGWLHYVCLIKTRRQICNMTYFGHYVTLTWDQVVTLKGQGHNLTSGQLIYFSKCFYETKTMIALAFGNYLPLLIPKLFVK